mmetsp:Transcript_81917/g.155544  ORF Transcript_81917/g.155544 Transcript_81917/m.155544 type:complete len:297 (+) Transcript_81917:61-951(+)
MHSSVKCALLLTLAAVAVTTSDAQTMSMRGHPLGHAVAWSRSFSFFQGKDGEMHNEMHEVETVFGHHGEFQEIQVDCHDSHCRKSMGFLAPRIQPAEVINTLLGEVRAPMSPETLLQHLRSSQHGFLAPSEVKSQAPPPFMAPLQVIRDAPDFFGSNLITSDAQSRHAPQAFPDRLHMKKIMLNRAPMKTGPTACAAGDLKLCLQQNAKVAFSVLGLGSVLLGLMTMMACMKFHRSTSARERPLQALAEPFVTDVVEDCTQAPTVLIQKASNVQPVASIEDGVPMYLTRLYARVLA